MTAGSEPPMFDGQPRGREAQLSPGGTSLYVVEPKLDKKPTRGILLLPDHAGWKAKNVRLYADKFANDGQLAVVPDLFNGDNPPLRDMLSGDTSESKVWQARHTEEQVLRDIGKLLDDLKQRYAVEKIGAVGFCIGALHGALLAGGDQVQAVVLNHGRSLRKELFEQTKQPMLVNWAETDDQMPPEERDAYVKLLEEMRDVPTESQVYENTTHGWMLQSSPETEAAARSAYAKTNQWLLKYL